MWAEERETAVVVILSVKSEREKSEAIIIVDIDIKCSVDQQLHFSLSLVSRLMDGLCHDKIRRVARTTQYSTAHTRYTRPTLLHACFSSPDSSLQQPGHRIII